MKKTAHLLLLSVAAAAVASCSENTEFEENLPAGDGGQDGTSCTQIGHYDQYS